jgi:hypothetical protein
MQRLVTLCREPSEADLPDRIQARNALACQHLNLPQLNNNLFRLRSRNPHLRFSVFLTIGTDQFKGGGSIPSNECRNPQAIIPLLGQLVSSAVYPQVMILKLMTLLYISTEGYIG